MQEPHLIQHVVKQMIEERQREAARESLSRRHSRAGMLRRFLDTLARRGAR